MLTQREESTQEVLLQIGKSLQDERQKLLKIRDNLDKIVKDYSIIIIKLTDRH